MQESKAGTFAPRAEVVHGDCLAVMPRMEADTLEACVTDPPYNLAFMGKAWDGAIAFNPATWAEALRVLKPGAHLLAFGGTRTYHRMACAVEDAGFEIRDCLMWLYGVGYPKSRNLHGEWEGWGSALKPAWEPVIVARKPLSEENIDANVQRWGTGALNIAAGRLSADGLYPVKQGGTEAPTSWGKAKRPSAYAVPSGRWPANVALDEDAARALDEASGERPSGSAHVLRRGATTGAGMGYGSSAAGDVLNATYGDTGGASRFFFCAKADRAERDAGLAGFPERPLHWSSGDANPGSFQAEGTRKAARNDHPCVKPLDLMRWLCRLVTPPGGTILDPFCGSGSTLVAAAMEGFHSVGIDSDAHYCDIARRRVWAAAQPRLALGAER